MTRQTIADVAGVSDTVLAGLRAGARMAENREFGPLSGLELDEINLHLREAVKEALRLDIKQCWYSREEIAERLSRLSGRQFGRLMIDAWVAVTNRNSIPAYLTPLWVRAAESPRLLEIMTAAAGLYLADQRQYDLAKLAEADFEVERIRRLTAPLRSRLGFDGGGFEGGER